MSFKGKNILITGATGSFGKSCVKYLQKFNLKKIIIFSRDELKQDDMRKELNSNKIRYLLGDVRDLERLKFAFKDVDYVIHAAALKQVPAAEYNPVEFIKTNIYGSNNIIVAAIDCNVKKVIALSTDKAVNPINLYGATKLCAEKLFLNANAMSGHGTRFSVVRYGNVINSRGSIVPIIQNLKNKNIKFVPLTDLKMTRFFVQIEDAVKFVVKSLKIMDKGEVFIPKMPAAKITDLIKAIYPDAKFKIIGIRPGEKLNEILISEDESNVTYELKDSYILLNQSSQVKSKILKKFKKFKKIKKGFEYSSNQKQLMTKAELKKILKFND
jgi:UDP-N-acetylglucosamine 4,6-dehydratase